MAVAAEPATRTRRFTADEFFRMYEVGILREEERLELIDGELCLVTPVGPEHTFVVGDLNRRLSLAYGEHFIVLVQNSVAADAYNVPEPDLFVVPARGDWAHQVRLPSTDESLLVVEVAVTSRSLDRRKSVMYQATGTPVYWIIDVPRRCVIVHEGPRPDGTWEHITEVGAAGAVDLPGLPGVSLVVGEFLSP